MKWRIKSTDIIPKSYKSLLLVLNRFAREFCISNWKKFRLEKLCLEPTYLFITKIPIMYVCMYVCA